MYLPVPLVPHRSVMHEHHPPAISPNLYYRDGHGTPEDVAASCGRRPPQAARSGFVLNIDFVNEGRGPGARIAVEMSASSGRQLMKTIAAAPERAEARGQIVEETPRSEAG